VEIEMEPINTISGIVAPLDKMNVDTDQIIPKQFLKRIERTGFGEFLFFDWRFKDDGTLNPQFELNKERYKDAKILLTRDNFGSGSSREHAPWALKEYGFIVIIAPSFADIFYNNCFKNRMLPIVLDRKTVDVIFSKLSSTPGYSLNIDLKSQRITDSKGMEIQFEIDPFKKKCLLEGLDDISITLLLEENIKKHESRMARV
jgi:3-isopropylmalate/(R)-2-methylmalate dehydratase small subunit